MTTEAVADHLTDKVLPDFVDSYILIANVAGSGDPIIRVVCHNQADADRINSIMLAILQTGGVPHG